MNIPWSSRKLSNFVANKMVLPACPPAGVASSLIDPTIVIEWQDSTFNWRNLTETEIGRHFTAEGTPLRINVLDYSTRKIIGHSEMQGHLRAQCRVFEISPADSQPAAPFTIAQPAWTSLIDIKWPPPPPLAPTQTNEARGKSHRIWIPFQSALWDTLRSRSPREVVPTPCRLV